MIVAGNVPSWLRKREGVGLYGYLETSLTVVILEGMWESLMGSETTALNIFGTQDGPPLLIV